MCLKIQYAWVEPKKNSLQNCCLSRLSLFLSFICHTLHWPQLHFRIHEQKKFTISQFTNPHVVNWTIRSCVIRIMWTECSSDENHFNYRIWFTHLHIMASSRRNSNLSSISTRNDYYFSKYVCVDVFMCCRVCTAASLYITAEWMNERRWGKNKKKTVKFFQLFPILAVTSVT